MAVEFGTVANYGLIALIVNGVLMWIREWRKHRTWSKNGTELSEIKTTMILFTSKLDTINEHTHAINVTMAEVKTSVTGQQKACNKTVTRFDKAIGDQNDHLISLVKEQGRRK